MVTVLLALVLAAGYFIACIVWPYMACKSCEGAGRSKSPTGKAWRPCRGCKGSGRRTRVGRKVYDRWRGNRD